MCIKWLMYVKTTTNIHVLSDHDSPKTSFYL